MVGGGGGGGVSPVPSLCVGWRRRRGRGGVSPVPPQDFAVNLERRVSSVKEALQMKTLTLVIDACKVLAQGRKVRVNRGRMNDP